MARYEVFPFSQLQAIKLHFFPFEPGYRLPVTEQPDYEMDVSHFRMLNSHPTIVMLGDSITAGGEWLELFPRVSIVNRGIGGDTTKGIIQRLDEVVNRQPKAVFILIGINDLALGESIEGICDNYRKIIELLQAKTIRVFIQSTILPGGNVVEERRKKVIELNKRLKALCSSIEGVTFIDLNQVLAPAGVLDAGYTLDGIHLNGKGYWEWAQTIKPAVEQFAGGNG